MAVILKIQKKWKERKMERKIHNEPDYVFIESGQGPVLQF